MQSVDRMQSAVNKQYNIILPNDKAATYKVVTFIIALVNATGFTVFYLNETEPGKQILVVLGTIISIIAFVFYILQLTQKKLASFRVEISFVIAALIWCLYGNILLGLILLVFAIFGFYSNRKLVVKFDEQGIDYPSFPAKHFAWSQVDFALLKDGILTIEIKDNRVFQFTLSKEESEKLDEADFNDFCEAQTAKTLRR